ncbi:arginine--tRNA ligase [Spirochaeta isovalerica]|uniref:Arginine--tRNA ligase n=1 Tax=Spirochaeta isovalerica TaxID=150 RepID=A0A841R590_9SPIO|nr:arginine--tRNA ligase [Spirochaeta isovalerica]MBB6479035.1 arginyl-tRNA synthetase [Spirochaeta isovalerica]
MQELKEQWKDIIAASLKKAAAQAGIEMDDPRTRIIVETPPKPEMGDLAFPMFPFARDFRKAPPAIAADIAASLGSDIPGEAKTAGPYINIFISRQAVFQSVLQSVGEKKDDYGRTGSLKGEKVMIEFSSPNTNKPLHLGHLRNDILGESTARILEAAGAEVMKVNLINNRGVHICKSMLAYSKFGKGETPESTGVKGDHFVGDYYVKYNNWAKEDSSADGQAQEMLKKWEDGDSATRELWKTMNKWTLDGINQTYEKTDISFDRFYFESETYLSGKDIVLKGLEDGHFYKDDDGSIRLDMSDIGLDTKVLLRGDGTSVYVTQDLGTAIARHGDFPFDRLIYVVGNEQEYHFKVLFHTLKKLGYEWADQLYHLSYGMVNLPEGKMKSREGTVVDADDLLAQLEELVVEEIKTKGREEELDDVTGTAHAIALGALNYYLLHISPLKDMVFNPKESLSFNGNTGPYMQYMGARISSMLRKYEEGDYSGGAFKPELLASPEAWELVKLIGAYPGMVDQAASEMNPSVIASFVYELSRNFSRFYHENPILNNDDADLIVTRIELSKAVLQVLKNAFKLINIRFLEKM